MYNIGSYRQFYKCCLWRLGLRSELINCFHGDRLFLRINCAGVFHTSPKTENGALESKAGFKGLVRKGMILLVVLVASRLDVLLGLNYIRNAACIAFMVNELISFVENLGLMGVPFPETVKNAIELLQKKGEKHD